MSLLDVTRQQLDWASRPKEADWHLILSQRTLSDHTLVYANLYCGAPKVTSAEAGVAFATTLGVDYLEQLPPRSVYLGPISLTKVTRVCRTCVVGAQKATGTYR